MSVGGANERMRPALIPGIMQCDALWAAVPSDTEAALLTRTRARRLPNKPQEAIGGQAGRRLSGEDVRRRQGG